MSLLFWLILCVVLFIVSMIVLCIIDILAPSPSRTPDEENAYQHWRWVSNGGETTDLKRNTGDFLMETFGSDLRGTIKKYPIKGKIGVFKLLEYKANRDHEVTESTWHLLRFDHEKPVKECTFEEYLEIYFSVLKNKTDE